MKRSWSLLFGLLCLGAVACNAILGVDDVKLKKTPVVADDPGTGDDGSSTSSSGGTSTSSTSSTSSSSTSTSGGADASSGVPAKPECDGFVDCERVVFVTRAAFTGNLGGLAGADASCKTAGDTIPGYAGHAFRAWLSDSQTNASTRIPHGTQAFKRTDGSTFSTSFAAIVAGTIANPLLLDEKGIALTPADDQSAWTATSAVGMVNGTDDCIDWFSDVVTDSASFGDTHATDATWTALPSELASCNSQKHLYCVEY